MWSGGLCGCIRSGHIRSGTWAGGAGDGTWSVISAGGGDAGSCCTHCAASCSCCSWGKGCGGAGDVVFKGLCAVGSFSAGGPLSIIVASVFTDLVMHL